MSVFQLSVWKPFRSTREIYYAHVNGSSTSSSVFDKDKLHESIYLWSPDEDIFNAIEDEPTRLRLRELLLKTFDQSKHPSERNLNRLCEVVEQIETITKEDNAQGWLQASQVLTTKMEQSALRYSPMMALCQHLRWICETFETMPDLHVMVR